MRETIAVWFSCGAASAVAAKLTVEKYASTHDIRILNNPVKEEHKDNFRFLKDIERWIGVKIELVTHPDFPTNSAVNVWEKRKYMSGVAGAPCTQLLKKKARQIWQKNNHVDWHVLGFTADELKRHERFTTFEMDNVLPVLIEANLTKQDCFNIIKEAGIELPKIYSLGYPNANCIGCVKSTSPSYWDLTRNVFPDVFKQRCEQSRRLGVKLVRYQGKRIFLDELPEEIKRKKITKTVECGIFCEEK